MKKSVLLHSLFEAAALTVLVLLISNIGFAQVRSSASYQLQSDSINIGGGLSTSTSYVQESTVGEVATGESASASYALRAGYQQMQEVFLSLSVTGDAIMDQSIPGVTGGVANGSSTVTVITDSPSGYQTSIVFENAPAMQNPPYTIADYDHGVEPDFSFVTGAGAAHFGYTPEGIDITQFFKDDGGTCNTGGQDTIFACWAGASTTAQTIAVGAGANHPAGATTTLHFRVGVGSGAGVMAGVYIATTTVTALPL